MFVFVCGGGAHVGEGGREKKTEAAANGHDGPTTSQRWEDVVFDQLLPLITYADGTPFPPDQRDERKGGGLGTSVNARKRRRECDTTTNRYPDALGGRYI